MWHLISLLVGAIIVPSDVSSVRTKNTLWPEYEIFYPITESNFISFDVWAGHDAWIGLFSEMYPTAPKYEVLLGANSNSLVLIVCNRTIKVAKKNIQVLDSKDYRGFVIQLDNRLKLTNRTSQDLKISVFSTTHNEHEIETVQPLDFEIKYFAFASTGADNNAYWKLTDQVTNSGIEVNSNFTAVTTISSTKIYFSNYMRMTDNILRFYIKADKLTYLWIRFTPDTQPSNSFEIVMNAYKIMYGKNGRSLGHSGTSSVVLLPNQFTGFWIDFNDGLDYYGNTITVICVGRNGEIEPIVRVTDTLRFDAKYFSIATTIDKAPGEKVYWLIQDLLQY